MGMKDFFKNMINLPVDDYDDDDDFYDEDQQDYEEEPKNETAQTSKQQKSVFDLRSSIGKKNNSSKVVNLNSSQIQVVLVKPTRFEDAPSIADHLNERKTVVLNLEAANRETSRRLIDFLSGTAYATRGSIKKVANSTYIITPANVDVLGDLVMDDFDSEGMFTD